MTQADIEFVNRQYELELICKPITRQFIIINAPAGYGKTYLLKKIEQEFQQRSELQSWKVCSIDLKSDPNISNDKHFQAWPAVANAIVHGFGGTQKIAIRKDTSEEQAQQMIANKLVPFIAMQRSDILLLFDGLETLDATTNDWVIRLVLTLMKGLEDVHRQLRVIFAGRNVRSWGQKLPVRENRSLSPFDHKVVRDLIARVNDREKINAQPDYLNRLSWHVLRLSGGHPRGIRGIVSTILDLGFIIPNLEFTFHEQKFIKDNQEISLFQYNVEENIQIILENVDPVIANLLEGLSPIRRFNLNLLILLIDQQALVSRNGPIDWKIFGAPNSETAELTEKQKIDIAWDLLKRLRQTDLIAGPTAAIPMFSDDILRRMLAMKTQLLAPELYQKTNQFAKKIFKDWINTPQEDAQLRRVAALENLYHTIELTPIETTQLETRNILENELKNSLAKFANSIEIEQLRSLFDEDDELKELIEQRAGANAPANLLDVIDNFLT
jgi:hypothetical protein